MFCNVTTYLSIAVVLYNSYLEHMLWYTSYGLRKILEYFTLIE